MTLRAGLIAATCLAALAAGPGAEAMSKRPGAPAQTPGYAETRNVYFGDLHIHTRYSFDAYIFNVRVTPDDAYRYAKGEAIPHASGYDIRLRGEPLDFISVTDHAEYLGMVHAMGDPNHPFSKHPVAKELIKSDVAGVGAAFRFAVQRPRFIEKYPELADEGPIKTAWGEIISAAERHNQPGRFTAFVGYEYTSAPDGRNLHRNVIFRGSQVPELPYSAVQSDNPEALWAWLDELRARGIEAMAIPHNMNGSDGLMFQRTYFNGDPIDAAYAELRMRNEPLVEISQVKGTSETHPLLSPNDEWSNFELFETYIGSARPVTNFAGGYVRDALKTGLEMEAASNFNPYRFGIIAASDTHNAGGPLEEQRYFGKIGIMDGTSEQRGIKPSARRLTVDEKASILRYGQWSASGLAAVWAEENTRESLYDALRRKEVYGTSGPRMRVRFFAGYGFEDGLAGDPDMVAKAYAKGVPMGGDLPSGTGQAPDFLVWALRDPNSAWLQRVQIVKGAIVNGRAEERVFDVACSDGLAPDPATHRCPDNGAKVDLEDCSFSQDKGAVELATQWRDPTFNPNQHAFYYVRVLENPTCRWSTWEALRLGVKLNKAFPPTIQERAWTSPIWYVPRG